MNSTPKPTCGVDTCAGYLERGDVVGTVRVGVGYAF
jgi:hypothetical protein